MSFTDVFIKRPVFSIVLSLIVLLVGYVSYKSLSIRQYPKIDTTVITVTTTYAGAGASLMEGFVTSPLESALAGVEGIDYMTSTSTEGQSTVTLNFKLNYDINSAAAEVSDKVSSVRSQLPNQIDDPIISKQDPNVTPSMYIAFTSDVMSNSEVTDYLSRVIIPQVETLEGIGQAPIFGPQKFAMRIWLNPEKMAGQGITATDVQAALMANNLQTPAGRITGSETETSIEAATDLNSADQFNNLVIRYSNGKITRIRDIGEAKLGAVEPRSSVLMDGRNATVLGITPRSDANPLDVSAVINKKLVEIQDRLPKDLAVKVIWDTSKFVASSIDEVNKTLIEATIIVLIVIFLFLGSLRALFIPMVTIPLSLIGVCAIMFALGYSLNTITLLALVLAIGMVVDDAIVVLENVHRHIELGQPPLAAGIIGAREITFPVIIMTITLAAVFAPIGFSGGLTGSLFKEFAFTLAASVIISGFVALTLSPMMCSRILTAKNMDKPLAKWIEHKTSSLANFYSATLVRVLNYRLVVVIIALLFLPANAIVYSYFLPQELAPQEDMGAIMTIVRGPASANLAYTQKYTQQLMPIYDSVPEKVATGIINGIPFGVNSAISFLVLTDWHDRDRNINQIIGELFPKLWQIPGVLAFAVNPFKLPGSSDLMPINVVVKTTGSYEDLYKVMEKFKLAAMQNPGLGNIDSNINYDSPQIDINIARFKSGDLGVTMADIGTGLSISLGQPTTSRFAISGRSYDVIPQLDNRFRNKQNDLLDIYLRTYDNKMVPLSNLVSISDSVNLRSLNHFQQQRSATLSGSPMPGYSYGEAIRFLQAEADKILTEEMVLDYSGQTRQFAEAANTMLYVFLFALVFIFLVLAAQFESFRDPLIIIVFSVFASTLGALITIRLAGGSINIYTQIGLLTLIGLISKHGILMVDFANHQQAMGKNVHDAIVEAAKIRLRPILMTTAAMVVGVLPLALATGAGAIARQQIGWTIVGGMTFGTFLTLFVIPAAYTYLAKVKKPFTTGDLALDKLLEVD